MAETKKTDEQTKADPAKAPRRYRLKEGAKFTTGKRDEDGIVQRKVAGEIVTLTPAQAKAFADRIEPAD